MIIQKIGNRYYATGQGLEAEGKTHLQALCRLVKEIMEMKSFYESICGVGSYSPHY